MTNTMIKTDVSPCYTMTGDRSQSVTLSYSEMMNLLHACEGMVDTLPAGSYLIEQYSNLGIKLAKFVG